MRNITSLAVLMVAVFAAEPALAHHVMGGELPNSWLAGLLSGLGHPIIGIDHLAFVIGVGLAASFSPRPALSPLAFVAGTLAGCGLLLGGVSLPVVELVITGSVVLIGAMILSGRSFPSALYLVLFAVAGLFHGWAYGESIVGAEATPLVAYLIGFAAVQYAIALAVALAVRRLWWNVAGAQALQPRLAGAVVAGIGFAFLVETIEGMVLPAV